MTDRERLDAFMREQTRQLNAWGSERRAGAADVVRILNSAQDEITRVLAAAPNEWSQYHLPKLQLAVENVMRETQEALQASALSHQASALAFGQSLLDAPLAAAGLKLNFRPVLDSRQLSAMRTFMTDKMQGVTAKAKLRINNQLGLVIAGAKTPTQAIDSIGLLLQGDRGRALTVMRTEVGRAYATATQERMEGAKTFLPSLQKEWCKSGKLHGRLEHILAHGQRRDVDKPFDVGGEKIMYPRAPGVSASNAINCGCESLPYMPAWEVRYPAIELNGV